MKEKADKSDDDEPKLISSYELNEHEPDALDELDISIHQW